MTVPAIELTLERFRKAHEESYETALAEIRSGRKRSHWIWYIFPQIQGLGHSAVAQYYAIQSAAEAKAYWNDPVLSAHLVEISSELLKQDGAVEAIMGYPDNLKLRSCMTLFYLISGDSIFRQVLDKFYDGSMDDETEKILRQHRIMGQGDSASVLHQEKVWKMREYWMYFPFFILHDWDKISAEARSSHCAVLP